MGPYYCYGCQRWLPYGTAHACPGLGRYSEPLPAPPGSPLRTVTPITEERIREIVREELERRLSERGGQ